MTRDYGRRTKDYVGRVERFEDLLAWQRARELHREIMAVASRPPFRHRYAFVNQIQRASLSVIANIAEGFDRGGRREFAQFLSMAKASCAEVRSHLYAGYDSRYFTDEDFDRLMSLAWNTYRLTARLRTAVANDKQDST